MMRRPIRVRRRVWCLGGMNIILGKYFLSEILTFTFIPIPFWNGSVVDMSGMVVSSNGLLDVPLLLNGVIPGCLFDGSKQQ